MLLEIGANMRKAVISASESCFRSVCNHPFLVGMLCFLVLLHRASPFIFSLLVSALPVVFCTLLLLGTLLSFGQPNIPEIEIEEKRSREIRNGVSKVVAFSDNDSIYGERHGENKTSEAEESKLALGSVEDSANDSARLVDRKSVEIESDNEGSRIEGSSDNRCKEKAQWNKEELGDVEIVENHFAASLRIKDDRLESETEKSEADSFDSERVNVDSLDSPPCSPWRRVGACDIDDEEEDEERDDDDDTLDSGSDRAESSSPDASMADITPMLDELHPLLDEDTAQPIQISTGGSSAESEVSSKSSSSSCESDDETEDNMDVEAANDDNDDGEEGEVQNDEESGNKSAITWTEEDQKNLMDLGSSELERNQRLESLILRRRDRKNLSMIPVRNLIDFESNYLPYHLSPITTMRQNPFDLPNDAHDNSGLPPLPGSAPSVLVPRRNPFDIPYDSNEEKPNLSNDGFREEFATFQSREPFFRRHERFNVGPSTLSHGSQDFSRFRPYFVPECSVSEESNYSQYQRNSSELSDSKVSSVPETESIGSVEHLEDQKFLEEENKHDLGAISPEEEEICEDPEVITEREVTKEDVTHETETVSEIKHVSEDVEVGHGSQSSEEEEESLELAELEKRNVENDNLQFQSPEAEDHYKEEEEEESVVQHVDSKVSECDSSSADGELKHNRNSSSSSLSEDEGSLISEKRHSDIARERQLSTQTSIGTDHNITSPLADDAPHKEPIYDSSPSAVRKNLSSSSISSDVHVESDPNFPPVLVKRTVFSSNKESNDFPKNIEMLPEEEKSNLVNISQLNRRLEIRCSIDKEEIAASPTADVEIFHEANERLISTPSADGGRPLFYDIVMHEPFNHLEEVQVPNTPVGSFEEMQTVTSLNIPQLQLINCKMSASINSPQSPNFASMASSASGEVTSPVNLETIIEEADEIKEVDEGILLELDSVSDFHMTQHESSDSRMSDKHVYSGGESTSTARSSVTSSTGLVITRQEMSRNGIVEHVATSDKEFHDINVQDYPDDVKFHSQASTNNNESEPGDFTSERPETEAQMVKDIDVPVSQSSETEIKKPVVSESL